MSEKKLTDSTGSLVRLAHDNGVATVTLANPAGGNAFSVAMAQELAAAVKTIADDVAVRCVLLTGEGRFFSVGGDVKSMIAADDVGVLLEQITDALHAAITTLLRMDKPLVVAVNGPVAGGGLGLALSGDVVLAADAAHFSLAYSGIGFSPDAGATWLLPRLIGLRRTQELAFLNTRLSSAEAVSLGLITRSVPDAELIADALAVAHKLAAGPVGAFAATRRLLLFSPFRSPEAQMSAEALSVRAQATGAEGQEGLSAFVARRPPSFAPLHVQQST